MRKLKLWFVFVAVLLVAAPLQGGVSLAEDTYTVQYITAISGPANYLGYLQGIGGFDLNSFSDRGQVNVNFTNVDINGIYNNNLGIGSFRNQGSIALANFEPDRVVTPVTLMGTMFSQGNKVTVTDYNYAVNLNFNGFRGSGLLVLDYTAGSFINQFTSLTFNMGKNAIPSTPLTSVFKVSGSNPTVVSLTNQQMQVIAATADNDFKYQGKQSATAAIEGNPNIQGVYAITVSSGVNNRIGNHVGVNIDTK